MLKRSYSSENQTVKIAKFPGWGIMILDLPWIDILTGLWKIGRKVIRGMANEGVYETLEYESTLEIHDRKGKKATFSKPNCVQYHI